MFKLGYVSVHVRETEEETATSWFLSLGKGYGLAAFLGVNLTLNICVDFNYYFF